MNATETRTVQMHAEHGRDGHPAVDIKLPAVPDIDEMLPILDTTRRVGSDPAFTAEWIAVNVTDADQEDWWLTTCRDGFEQAVGLAKETFGQYVEVYGEGRSGSWLVVYNLPDPSQWNEEMHLRWQQFSTEVRQIADGIPAGWLWNLWTNVFEPWRDAQPTPRAYTLTVTTTNPDLAFRVAQAFGHRRMATGRGGARHTLSARLVNTAGELVWASPTQQGT